MSWTKGITVEMLNARGKDTMVEYLDIIFTEVGPDYLIATMPVTARHVQPFRILHGGANVVLAETMGSVASSICISDRPNKGVVGVEINANHLKSVREGGAVKGVCSPIRIGKSVHVWQIDIYNEQEQLTCTSRLTVMVVDKL